MRFIVLGSAAGGGLPQWNCACSNCDAARRGDGVAARTQSSMAVSVDDSSWALINASPDLGAQIRETPVLWPTADRGLRNSPIRQVFVTNSDVDHIAGLLTLREGQAFELNGTAAVLDTLAANRIFNVLAPEHVTRTKLPLDEPVAFTGVCDVTVTAFAVPGKVALFEETPEALGRLGERGEETIGLELQDHARDRRALLIPGCAEIDATLKTRIDGVDVLFFDGTLFEDTEMLDAGLSAKTGRRMGHVPIAGPGGSLEALAEVRIGRRVFVHINNSNPIVRPDHPAAKAVQAAGWEVAWDGMEVVL